MIPAEPVPERFATIADIMAAARRRLPPDVWDYASGGSGAEVTLHRNRSAFDRITFRPRVLRDVRTCDCTTTFAGIELAQPVMLAPVGGIAEFDPDGALACARAAATAGTAAWISTLASPDLETVAQGRKSGEEDAPLVFQLYVRGDRDDAAALVERALEAGYRAICLTVDSPVFSRRERDLRNRFRARERKDRPNLTGTQDRGLQALLTWDDVAWLRGIAEVPLILKGILTAEDALLAIDHGADAIVVSNHGGRQLDSVPASMEVLAEIIDAVDGRLDVAVDSGFQSGTDVVKALALGARAVLIGKLQCWALAAGGQAALEQVLALLDLETSTTMALLGVTSVEELSRDHVVARP